LLTILFSQELNAIVEAYKKGASLAYLDEYGYHNKEPASMN
jgi:hypothetical protein